MNRQSHSTSSSTRRTEPVLGDLDRLDESLAHTGRSVNRQHASQARAGQRRGWVWLLLALVLVVLGWAWMERQTLRSWLPHTQLNQLLERADRALAAGRLDGTQGNSARELYSAARALQGDNERALGGLQKVGQAEYQHADAAFKHAALDQAEDYLRKARALLGGGSKLDDLDRAIAVKRAQGSKVTSLVERAGQALADRQLDGRHGAAALYKQILTAEPGNAIARHGLDKVGAALAMKTRAALTNKDLDAATDMLHNLATLLPEYADLPALRAELAGARKQSVDARRQLLAQATADLAAGRIAGSGQDNALARYRLVLDNEPDNSDAQAGLQKVAAILLQRAIQSLDDGHLDQAEALLDEVGKLAPRTASLKTVRERIEHLRQQNQQQAAVAAPPTAQQRARVQGLMTRAQAAAASGDLLLPPGRSAYDLYRAALSVEPDNSDAMAGLASLPGQARSLFKQAIARHDTGRATHLLAAFAQLAPGSSALPAMRARLAAAGGGN